MTKHYTATYRIMEWMEQGIRYRKNHGLDPSEQMTLEEDQCPCSICGHETMEDCDLAGCDCCSSVCT